MIQLSEFSTEPDEDLSKEKAEELRLKELERIEELQIRLFAGKKKSLLIILQGVDASGKDGTVKKLFSALNPLGCTCKAWKAPTQEELSRDFLWRIHKELPPKGWIQIFNRSHYEDILVPYVYESLSKDRLRDRLEFIDSFEEFISEENHTHILKFFLHISQEEQIKRIEDRLSNPEKNWKFDPSDLEAHKNFKKYQDAYEWIFSHSKDRFPWVIVPSDKKWYRDYLISKAVRKELEDMDLKYPKLEVQPDRI
ncbi:PPK2 family polyphosphate kinase [Leptospira dzoumogneensis]|uniref:Polyphosphate kinase n=1 Tax=Leptospira dzoumogneensis TaxID=2484904 RepID=A0A4Z1AMJ3_9LEPT|nr:PPK2 family polyphosphate kinase [Leptospira dzoumogneensis]TGN02802.1 polyphosphate kinase [Leptospira dzoumogneensis]